MNITEGKTETVSLVEGEHCGKNMETDKSCETVTFKVPSMKLLKPSSEFSNEKESDTEKPKEKINQSIDIKSSKSGDDKNKVQNLSSTTLQKQSKISIPYTEPSWGGACQQPYFFEIVKNGTVIDKMDLCTKSYYVFGRIPTCDVTMDHPSLSRYHAVVQHCVRQTEKQETGWYLYDLDSTHGTQLNKNKIKPRVFYRLRVGHIVKFAGSSRLHVLQGPGDDQENESDLTVTEIKNQRERQKKEIELLKQAELREIEEKKKILQKSAANEGCSWGIDDDAEEIDSNNPFALEQPQNEDLYIDDPKKSLKGYFEREGLDLPEYEIEDLDRGKYRCQVELPVYAATGEVIVAEATVSGKKKEAVVACALEACRILDRMGELRKATHESRKRKAKNWEENDFYDSDEDTFLDRTGDIEQKRLIRMQKFGHKKKEKSGKTYEELVTQLDVIEKEMSEIQEQLDSAKAKAAAVEAEDGLDALDLFMANIKSGAMDTKTKMSLKRRLFDLKKEQTKLQKLTNLAKPAELPSISKSLPKSGSKTLSAVGKIKKPPLKKPQLGNPSNDTSRVTDNTEFTEEMEEEEDDEEEVEKVTEQTSQLHEQPVNEKPKPSTSCTQEAAEECVQKDSPSSENVLDKLEHTVGETVIKKDNLDTVAKEERLEKSGKKDMKGSSVRGPTLPTQAFIKHAKKKKKNEIVSENIEFDPDYVAWVPPEGQSGDGKTKLNEKYGY